VQFWALRKLAITAGGSAGYVRFGDVVTNSGPPMTAGLPASAPGQGISSMAGMESSGRIDVPIWANVAKTQDSGSYHNPRLSHKTCNSSRIPLLSAIETGLQSRWVINAG
jgi:hypothetical protein